MPSKLTMNPTMGKKWFIFYSRVRPWFIIFSALAICMNAVLYTSFYINNIFLFITLLASMAQFTFAIRIFIWSYKDYEDFVKLANCSLILDIFTIPYSFSIQLYYEKACAPGPTVIIGTVILLLTYLLWYRPNIMYFRKRLYRASTVVTPKVSVQANRISTADNAPHTNNDPHLDLQVKTSKRKYCSNCGEKVDPITKQCSGCGKQYFKGISGQFVFKSLLVLLFVVSIAGNILLSFKIEDERKDAKAEILALNQKYNTLKSEMAALERNKDAFYKFYQRNHDKVEFIDAAVVFIDDDGSRLYHKYECEKFVGENYWAHNTEYAQSKGYKPCSLCIK